LRQYVLLKDILTNNKQIFNYTYAQLNVSNTCNILFESITYNYNNSMSYQTVYDFANESINIELILITFGLALVAFSLSWTAYKKLIIDFGEKRPVAIYFGLIVGTFFLLFGIYNVPKDISRYYATKEIYESKNYKIVEGFVQNYKPMPVLGHSDESFMVDSVFFSYSDFDKSYYGFNQTSSHGGPIIGNGMFVRIAYFYNSFHGNIILKIEVATNSRNYIYMNH
jgi:hypothetical protein